ncbi:MAG: dihydropteroate synthase, partial [Gammaproteobacteria bacterium]|nr:dihydropteroate synthase [Gammaproteobacteria bacterium]
RALQAAAKLGVAVSIMHMQGDPKTMQCRPQYTDVVNEVKSFLQRRKQECVRAGINGSRVIVDPGFGFGKTAAHNIKLLKNLGSFSTLDSPILVGLSRKSMIGKLLKLPPDQRVYASVSLALIALQNGASIIRAHDIGATCQAVRMYEAVYNH